jgi:hypothetical protein
VKQKIQNRSAAVLQASVSKELIEVLSYKISGTADVKNCLCGKLEVWILLQADPDERAIDPAA